MFWLTRKLNYESCINEQNVIGRGVNMIPEKIKNHILVNTLYEL